MTPFAPSDYSGLQTTGIPNSYNANAKISPFKWSTTYFDSKTQSFVSITFYVLM